MKSGKSKSIKFRTPPVISCWASIAGKKESEGPMAPYFDKTYADTYFRQKTWEQAESKMQEITFKHLLEKADLSPDKIELILSGDLLNQCIGSSFAFRNTGIPQLGLYGACSTMAESLLLAGLLVNSGTINNIVAMSSSHFAASERQYRFPLGYGGQRSPTTQWTTTGAGAALVKQSGVGPRITACTIGTVTDLGIKDANNMGAAMAPAALHTIQSHFQDLGKTIDDYDLIVTGDLGQLGKDLLLTMAQDQGLELGGKITDCGTIIFDQQKQDVHSGGSGCGCSAVVLCGYLLNKLQIGELRKILFCGTGALLSPTSVQQNLPIPAICHAVAIEGGC